MDTEERSLDNRRALSPVVGIILLVALAVILAAVVGAFALGLGLEESPPQATFETEQTTKMFDDGDTANLSVLTISHNGGDPVDTDNLEVVINEEDGGVAYGIDDDENEVVDPFENETISPGESIEPVFINETGEMSSGDRVVYSGGEDDIAIIGDPLDAKCGPGETPCDEAISLFEQGDEVTLVWSPEESDSGHVLAELEV